MESQRNNCPLVESLWGKGAVWASEANLFAARRKIQNDNRVVITAGSEPPPVRAERQRLHRFTVSDTQNPVRLPCIRRQRLFRRKLADVDLRRRQQDLRLRRAGRSRRRVLLRMWRRRSEPSPQIGHAPANCPRQVSR